MDTQLASVKMVLELADKYHLAELTVREGDLTITAKGVTPAALPQPTIVQQASPELAAPLEAAAEVPPMPDTASTEHIHEIKALLVGVFYRSPTPDSQVFVEVGEFVEVGREVGVIEAMKVFSPIPSDVSGKVIEIPASNGKLVQQGEVLMRIDTEAQPETTEVG